ncbi:MAG: hypothetical protein ACO3XN_06480, partial [Chthoniobacterales bacterium]
RTGYAADNAPSLVTRTFLETASDAFLRDAIGRGRPGTAMAGFAAEVGGPLSAPELEALIRYIRHDGPRQVAVPYRNYKRYRG